MRYDFGELFRAKERPLWVRFASVFDPYLRGIAQEWPINSTHEAFLIAAKAQGLQRGSKRYAILFIGIILVALPMMNNRFTFATLPFLPEVLKTILPLVSYLLGYYALYTVSRLHLHMAPTSIYHFLKLIQKRVPNVDQLLLVPWDPGEVFHVKYLTHMKAVMFALVAAPAFVVIMGIFILRTTALAPYAYLLPALGVLLAIAGTQFFLNSYVATPRGESLNIAYPMTDEEKKQHLKRQLMIVALALGPFFMLCLCPLAPLLAAPIGGVLLYRRMREWLDEEDTQIGGQYHWFHDGFYRMLEHSRETISGRGTPADQVVTTIWNHLSLRRTKTNDQRDHNPPA